MASLFGWVLLVCHKGPYRMVINVIEGSVGGVEREEQMTRAFLTQFGGQVDRCCRFEDRSIITQVVL